jgi:hypothetical protein
MDTNIAIHAGGRRPEPPGNLLLRDHLTGPVHQEKEHVQGMIPDSNRPARLLEHASLGVELEGTEEKDWHHR